MSKSPDRVYGSRAEQGSALLYALLAIGAVSAGAYVMATRARNESVAVEATQSSEQAETANLSNLAVGKALVQLKPALYNSALPSVDSTTIPNVYPDPYLPYPGGQTPTPTIVLAPSGSTTLLPSSCSVPTLRRSSPSRATPRAVTRPMPHRRMTRSPSHPRPRSFSGLSRLPSNRRTYARSACRRCGRSCGPASTSSIRKP